MRKGLGKKIGLVVAVIVFIAAAWTLYHQLKSLRYGELLRYVESIPAWRIAAAFLLAAASYMLTTIYEVMAFGYVGRPLPYRRLALSSLLAFSLGNSIGPGLVSSASVRYRLYAAWGIPVVDMVKAFIFCGLTFWLGFLALVGVAFLAGPLTAAVSARRYLAYLPVLGAVLAGLTLGYIGLAAARGGRPLPVWRWKVRVPAARTAVVQVAASSLMWASSAGVLYVLMPAGSDVNWAAFTAGFLIAQVTGRASQVPGGLAVFEAAGLALLSSGLPKEDFVGSLLLYRTIYYLLPLGAGAAALAVYEIRMGRLRAKALAMEGEDARS